MNIGHQRLNNQLLIRQPFTRPAEVVTWLGAVQAQEYGFAKWALGMRLPKATDEELEQAMADGSILRTHVMRPTWHFVAPADIRWMLALTAPRIQALNAYYYRKYELDEALLVRSNAAIAQALEGGKHLTRPELQAALADAGIVADGGLRTSYIMMRAELDMLVCSGARRGKQFTYALLDERVPLARALPRDEALAELARRFFLSHGPATLKDYAWWSGLTVADARSGLEAIRPELKHEVIDGLTYWFADPVPIISLPSPVVHLLPPYDEFMIAYKDQRAVLDPDQIKQIEGSNGAVIFLDGQIVGTWLRAFQKNTVVCTLLPFAELTEAEHHALVAVAERYGRFNNMPVVLS